MPNFPEISENIVKYIVEYKTGNIPIWKPGKGDLICNGKRLEVKCFTSNGPSSFGPTEEWDELYFLDATDYENKNFKCYKISLSNTEFSYIKINSSETYKDQCAQKRRPRISFNIISGQIPKEKINLLFEGNFDILSKYFSLAENHSKK